MSTNLEYRARERQKKRESGWQASEAQREKERRRFKKKNCSGGEKMRNASGHKRMQGEKERQWKKVNDNTYDISSIKRVTKKFLEVSRCSSAK